MSTLMTYTFQSFNFRGKKQYRPFNDLLCNIIIEEYSPSRLSPQRSTCFSAAPPRARIAIRLLMSHEASDARAPAGPQLVPPGRSIRT